MSIVCVVASRQMRCSSAALSDTEREEVAEDVKREFRDEMAEERRRLKELLETGGWLERGKREGCSRWRRCRAQCFGAEGDRGALPVSFASARCPAAGVSHASREPAGSGVQKS